MARAPSELTALTLWVLMAAWISTFNRTSVFRQEWTACIN
jgi:hypothetical protein